MADTIIIPSSSSSSATAADTSADTSAQPPSSDQSPAQVSMPPLRTSVPSIKLDNIKPLRGIDNYETWSCQVALVLFAIGAKSLVLTGVTPDGMSADVAHNLMQHALLVIIQLVSEPIMAQIASFSNAHEMWVYLKENFYADTYFSFVHQMQRIFSLQDSFDLNLPIGTFITNFEREWARLHLLCSGTSRYRQLMKQVLDQDEAKRDWMLAALVSHHPNLVDNMTTKDNLTFAQLKVRLHSLSSNVDRRAGSALVANHRGKGRRPDRKRKFNDRSSPTTSATSCTWCKARNFRLCCCSTRCTQVREAMPSSRVGCRDYQVLTQNTAAKDSPIVSNSYESHFFFKAVTSEKYHSECQYPSGALGLYK